VLLVTERFAALANAVKIGKGLPEQPSLQIRGNPEFCEDLELIAIVDGMLEEFVDLITPGERETRSAVAAREEIA
jgi:hypothetical protein